MRRHVIGLVTAALLTSGCGGGGSNGGASVAAPAPSAGSSAGSNPPSTQPSVDAGTADLVRGKITGFGSVYIDGNRFDTTDASFSKDDLQATQSDLRIGMMVEIRGDIAAGTAARVDFEEDIKGPVDSVGNNQLTVLGQTVLIVADTVIDDSLNLATLNMADIVEVSGLRGANDVLEASFIEDKSAQDVNAYKVIGRIRDLDQTAGTFRIGGLTIDYNAAQLDDDVSLADGQSVEVKDENKAYSPGDLRLQATKIEPAGLGQVSQGGGSSGSDSSSSPNGTPVRVEGLISEIMSSTAFSIGGTTVNHSSSTTFTFGDRSQLSLGTKVQVQGTLDSNNNITAAKIKFSRNSARIEGVVENVNFNSAEIVILGIAIDAGSANRLEDKRDDIAGFGMEDISIGDFLEVRGNSIGTSVRAYEIERDDADDTRLRGPANDINRQDRSLKILGVSIATSASTQYRGFNDESLSADAFFDQLQEGQTLVDAQWDDAVTDPSVAVRELSLED